MHLRVVGASSHGRYSTGANLYLAGNSAPSVMRRLFRGRGVSATELRNRFGNRFDLVNDRPTGHIGRASNLVLSQLTLRTDQTGS